MEEFRFEETEEASVPPDSLGEAELELGDSWLRVCSGDNAPLLSSSKLYTSGILG